MTNHIAVPISDVEGITSTDDGIHALVKCRQPDGEKFTLAIPVEKLLSFVGLFATEHTKLEKRERMQSGGANLFPIQWWEIGTTNDGGFVLSLQLLSGGILSFRLTRQNIVGIFEAIQSRLGTSISPKPEKALN